ncbi:MAG: hypothetical protein ACLP1D_06440 [Xanthobacteraceae bacterium]|jgi:hypothetical protein
MTFLAAALRAAVSASSSQQLDFAQSAPTHLTIAASWIGDPWNCSIDRRTLNEATWWGEMEGVGHGR